MINIVDPEVLDAFHRKHRISFVDPEHDSSPYPSWNLGARAKQSEAAEIAKCFGDTNFAFQRGFNIRGDKLGLAVLLEAAEQVVASYRRTNIWGTFNSPKHGRPAMEALLKQLRYLVQHQPK